MTANRLDVCNIDDRVKLMARHHASITYNFFIITLKTFIRGRIGANKLPLIFLQIFELNLSIRVVAKVEEITNKNWNL